MSTPNATLQGPYVPIGDEYFRTGARALRKEIDYLAPNGQNTTPQPSSTHAANEALELQVIDRHAEPSSSKTSQAIAEGDSKNPDGRSPSPPPTLHVVENNDDERRKVSRILEWYHIFFIALSGTLGVGLYVQGGAILRLGGPYALIVSFTTLSFLAWAVMQPIAEMLCLWPISGALSRFVSVFVDEDLGTAVGVAYWLENATGFAAVIMSIANEIEFWSADGYLKGFGILFAIPASLLLINTLGVKPYAWIELVGGCLKLSFIFTIIVITLGIVIQDAIKGQGINERFHGSHFDENAASNQVYAFFMCFRLAAFAFVGIEITAATALEAKASTRRQGGSLAAPDSLDPVREVPISRLKRPATKLPVVVGIVYTLAALLIALSVDANHPSLPAQGWTNPSTSSSASTSASAIVTNSSYLKPSKSTSAFVIAAESAGWKGLPHVITAFIVITAITTANTQLYVGSRTLFGLTRESDSNWRAFGRTTRTHRVPLSALLATAIFIGLPFLSFLHEQPKAIIFDVLSTTSSLLCITVWACLCFAFIRYFYCIKRFQDDLNRETEFDPPLNRFLRGTRQYPWLSHGQSQHPVTAICALCGCLFILLVANFACLWSAIHWQALLSSFLAPVLFIGFYLYLKIRRDLPLKDWKRLVNFENYQRDVRPVLKELQDIRNQSMPREGEEEIPAPEIDGVADLSWWRRRKENWF